MKQCHKAVVLSFLFPLVGFASDSFQKIPSVVSARMPVVSNSQASSEDTVMVTVAINEEGFVTKASLKSSSNPDLDAPCLRAVREWRYEPAVKDGHAVAATFVQPIRFKSDTLSTEDVTASAAATHRVSPELTEDLEHITGAVTLVVKLSESGSVENVKVGQSTHVELNAACLAAIQKWTFSPAIKQGVKVASTVHVPFRFIGNGVEVAKTAARAETLADNHELHAVRQTSPQVPEELREAGGNVRIAFTVDEKGFVSNATVKSATSPELAELARTAMLNWKFSPIVRNGKPVAVNAVQPFNFGEGVIVAEVVDKMPKASHVVSPTLPDSLRGVRGRVEVQFVLKDNGEVASVEVKDATNPEMSEPILAAAKQWRFTPAIKGGKPVDSRVVVPFLVGSAD